MSVLAQVTNAVEAFNRFVEQQVSQARSDSQFGEQLMARWQAARAGLGTVTIPTALKLPRLALPLTDEPGEVARYLYGEGLPGEFPFVNAAYREMYLVNPNAKNTEEPTRLFAGLALAEDTNHRFHYL
ncbi:MAG TPA: hypothetical protein VKA81_02495, partial [Verrucomicrobiae bacterium]|nr:hypothetical protein [Verrucomicrobiae bacterium]